MVSRDFVLPIDPSASSANPFRPMQRTTGRINVPMPLIDSDEAEADRPRTSVQVKLNDPKPGRDVLVR